MAAKSSLRDRSRISKTPRFGDRRLSLRAANTSPVPSKRRKGNGKKIVIKGAKCHNLKNLNVSFPLGTFTVVTGVSGSGKSSLVNETLYKAIQKKLTGEETFPGAFDSIRGLRRSTKSST
jgi:excinuclease ABC subunit A